MRRPSLARRPLALAAAALVPAALAGPVAGVAAATPAAAAGPVAVARDAAPVVLTGAQLPTWSRLPATGLAKTYPSGSMQQYGGDGVRSAHNGTLTVPPDTRTGVDPDTIAAYRWDGTSWVEVPVQVDQRFPYFLANGHSDFAFYSGTDEELTYAWTPGEHAAGEEAWKKVFGECSARYAQSQQEYDAAVASGAVSPRTAGAGADAEGFADYTGPMADPVPTLDDDDEIAFMASDAGEQAPADAALPPGVTDAQQVAVVDPLDPAGTRFVYLGLKPGGSAFTADTGYVHHERAADADEFIDRYSFDRSDPEVLGVSNTGYGPNEPGTVCTTSPTNDHNPPYPTGVARPSTDRFPRDAMSISTDTYRLTASGRWMVRGYQVAAEGQPGAYGPDLVDRWKGRAFQQSPDSTISVVGFEDEQVNWEANSALLGWRSGPVRTIREVWGADSGTNVTKTETYYRDADVYRYHVRVHPIPSDGLYTSWDYNAGAVSTYYNLLHPDGVPIDGINDDTGQVDQLPGGEPAYFDAPDPTFDAVSAVDRPEEVAGPNGGAVYVFEFKGATSATNADAVPYYRDDRCLDDGTGDSPVNRPFPGDSYTDGNGHVADYYVALAKTRGAPADLTIDQLVAECKKYAAAAPWAQEPFQGAFASHGIHFFTTQDSDNATLPKPTTEIDGQQWRFAVPMSAPRNVLTEYAPNVDAPLQAVAAPFTGTPASSVPEVPAALLLPLAALGVGGAALARRRRREAMPHD